jgi:type 1 glutamine amidotransferase
MMKRRISRGLFLSFLFVAGIVFGTQLFAAGGKLKGSRVLVYTKNGKGYVHDNIASAVACIKELGKANRFTVDVADTSLVFTEENLKKYNMLIFTSTNNDVFATDAQRVAFRRYIEAGGGFVGVHSVTGTEREDECYFGKELCPGIKVLMAHDLSTLNVTKEKGQDSLIQKNLGSYKEFYPAVWYQQFQGGNVWVTTLGHTKEAYQDATYQNHLLQGIKFMATQYKGLNYANAHATSKDDALK